MIVSSAWDRHREGSRTVRRGGHPPAAHHPHLRQAAGPGGQQAGALLRPGSHRATPGITEVGIDRRRHRRRDPEAVGDGSAFGLEVTYIPQDAPLGLAHAVLIARDFLGDDDFVMYLGDNFIVGGIADLVDEFRADRPDAQILLTQVADPTHVRGRRARRRRAGRRPGGEAEAAEERSGAGRRLPLHPGRSTRRCAPIKPSGRGELEITDAIQWLIDQRRDVRSTHDHRLLEGHRQRRGHAGVQPLVLETVEPPIDGDGRRRQRAHRPGRIEEGAEVTRLARSSAPSIIGAGTRDQRLLRRPVHLDRGRTAAIERQRDRVLDRAARTPRSRGVRRIEASLIGRDVEVTPGPAPPPPTGSCSATTARCRSPHDDPHPGHRRRRLHRLALRPHAARPAGPRRRRRSPCSTSSPTPATWPTSTRSATTPASPSSRATSATPTLVDELMPGHDAVVHFAAESHVDRSIAGARRSSAPTCSAPRPCSTPRLRHGVGRFVHVSTDEVYGSIDEGSWTETDPLAPNSPVRGLQGGLRPARARLPPHPRPGRAGHPLLQQLRAAPVPGEGHPAVRHQPARRQAGPALRRRRQRPRLAARRRPLPGHRAGPARRAAPARSTTSAAAPS